MRNMLSGSKIKFAELVAVLRIASGWAVIHRNIDGNNLSTTTSQIKFFLTELAQFHMNHASPVSTLPKEMNKKMREKKKKHFGTKSPSITTALRAGLIEERN